MCERLMDFIVSKLPPGPLGFRLLGLILLFPAIALILLVFSIPHFQFTTIHILLISLSIFSFAMLAFKQSARCSEPPPSPLGEMRFNGVVNSYRPCSPTIGSITLEDENGRLRTFEITSCTINLSVIEKGKKLRVGYCNEGSVSVVMAIQEIYD